MDLLYSRNRKPIKVDPCSINKNLIGDYSMQSVSMKIYLGKKCIVLRQHDMGGVDYTVLLDNIPEDVANGIAFSGKIYVDFEIDTSKQIEPLYLFSYPNIFPDNSVLWGIRVVNSSGDRMYGDTISEEKFDCLYHQCPYLFYEKPDFEYFDLLKLKEKKEKIKKQLDHINKEIEKRTIQTKT